MEEIDALGDPLGSEEKVPIDELPPDMPPTLIPPKQLLVPDMVRLDMVTSTLTLGGSPIEQVDCPVTATFSQDVATAVLWEESSTSPEIVFALSVLPETLIVDWIFPVTVSSL